MRQLLNSASKCISSLSLASLALAAISAGAAQANQKVACGVVAKPLGGGFNCGAAPVLCQPGNKPCPLPVNPVVGNPCFC